MLGLIGRCLMRVFVVPCSAAVGVRWNVSVENEGEVMYSTTDVMISTRPDGKIEYRNTKGELHREDGPAVFQPEGDYRSWWLNGRMHRDDGPATIYEDGSVVWYLHDYYMVAIDRNGTAGVGSWLNSAIAKPIVAQVMRDKCLTSLVDFCNWLSFDVLGEEAGPILEERRRKGFSPTSAIESYLLNYKTYEGLPFSWWWLIVSEETS